MVIIVTVLKEGKEYGAIHAQWLHAQLPESIPAFCMTDIEIPGVHTLPLTGGWPGWWSKLEAFNPHAPEIGHHDILLLDIDTVVVGNISPLLQPRAFTALTDFYREDQVGAPMASAVMYIPASVKERVWSTWLIKPEMHMRVCTRPDKHGDQGFVGQILSAERWQHVLPGAIVSYKKDVAVEGRWPRSCGTGEVPPTARLVCFHGQPRPWNSNEPWVPPLVVK